MARPSIVISLAALLVLVGAPDPAAPGLVVIPVTSRVPFPRGLAMVGDELYVLCRGRAREAGGVSADVDDEAGTIYVVEPQTDGSIGQAHHNGRVFARATSPPFKPWNQTSIPPESDRNTDRPYCTLRFHESTKSFFICAFSGVDKSSHLGRRAFSKNLTDAVLRYDLRTERWYEIDRHSIESGGAYPHHDPRYSAPPHGWLNGPDNCLPVGTSLYVVAKENSVLVRYDLSAIINDPEAGPAQSELVVDERVYVEDLGWQCYYGHSALAVWDRWLYIGYRTSSVIIRLPLDEDSLPVEPVSAQLVARFEPYDPITRRSADITDMSFDSKGRLYVVCALPARIYRFLADPAVVFDATDPETKVWLDLAAATGRADTKSENIIIDQRDRLFVTSGDAYDHTPGLGGVVYRVAITD